MSQGVGTTTWARDVALGLLAQCSWPPPPPPRPRDSHVHHGLPRTMSGTNRFRCLISQPSFPERIFFMAAVNAHLSLSNFHGLNLQHIPMTNVSGPDTPTRCNVTLAASPPPSSDSPSRFMTALSQLSLLNL